MSTPQITWDAPVQAAPPQIKWDEPTQPSAASRLGSNFLSGLGVTSNEQAKNFFVHPLDTVIKSFESQGELAKKARDAYDKGDYLGALQHGLNYLVPFIGQQTDQAGEQLKQGDIAGGVGRTLGAAVPIVAGSPEVQSTSAAVARAAADTGARAVRAAARGANVALEKAPGTVGASVGASIGGALAGHIGAEVGGAAGAMAGREILPNIRIPGEGFGLPNRVTGGPATISPEVEPPASLATPAAQPSAAAPAPSPEAAAAAAPLQPPRTLADLAGNGGGVPRTLNGESALRQVLTGQDNANLLKIARSRGINVTQEAQLRAGIADAKLIDKIVGDFSDDELSNMRDTYLENTRMGSQPFRSQIGAEANKTLSLQTYFPEVKISTATLRRTQSAIATAKTLPPGASTPDLLNILKKSLTEAQAKKALRDLQ